MKTDRHGKAAALSDEQMDRLIHSAPSPRYAALWSVQRFTAARISESLSLRWSDINAAVTFRKSHTKTKTTRQLPIAPALRLAIDNYKKAWEMEHGHPPHSSEALFPSPGSTHTPMTRQAADKAMRATCLMVGIHGATTHSFRRSLAQNAVKRGVRLHIVQRITGHKSLGSLGEYLCATDEEVLAAIVG
ncbi:MAG: site-specific integrase [Planctomycetota bacterium]|nr:site-specific integrase [Planctomycetota bacterium]